MAGENPEISSGEEGGSASSSKRPRRRSPLPTRVSNACERCRRHKSRCDAFRPCSLCERANVACRPPPDSLTQKAKHRQPTRSTRKLRTRHEGIATDSQECSAESHPQGRSVVSSDVTHDGADLAADAQSRRPSVDFGGASSAIGIAQKICQLGSQLFDEQATSAIPGYRASTAAAMRQSGKLDRRLPVAKVLGHPLPPMETILSLLDDYFDAVHWFSLVIYEPKFRKRLQTITDGFAHPSQKTFLLLLAVMLGMSSWYRSQRTRTQVMADDMGSDWQKWSVDLMEVVESHLIELMDQPSVTAIQTCILLGSHCVYHGRPNLSFAVLGATIKMSQALGLHSEPLRGSFDDIEERKRVWWTIYTWDRFASVTYGRPLGINDRDCNLRMPADVMENPHFANPRADRDTFICYSTYQRELNSLYMSASRALEAIFGSRSLRSSTESAGNADVAVIRDCTQKLQSWRSRLPDHLALNLERDYQPNSGPVARAHALQSLSLQLTYDNLLIVMHRPLLARRVEHLSAEIQSPGLSVSSAATFQPQNTASPHPGVPLDTSPTDALAASSVHWWNAALRTSRITELPILAQLAADSHLVAFLAINLFHAAIVLAVIALTDPLSDTAQVVKRTITRILRLQDLLGNRSALSKQSTGVLKNVVAMLLRRESEAILAPLSSSVQQPGKQAVTSGSAMSVEETLRLPLDAASEMLDSLAGQPPTLGPRTTHRLNESLASVQHALAPGDIVPVDFHMIRDDHYTEQLFAEVAQPENSWPQPLEATGWNPTSLPLEGTEDDVFNNGDGGLYWLWDMTWNGTGARP